MEKTTYQILQQSGGNPVAILNHNKFKEFLSSYKDYEHMLEILDDITLEKIVKKRLRGKTVMLSLDDL